MHARKKALAPSPICLALDKALSRASKDRGVPHPRHWTGQGAPMQSAQKQQDVDPAEGGIGAKYRDSLFGYQRIAKEIIASIEERLEELAARRSEDRPVGEEGRSS